jgi:hypothetical protein
MSTVGPKYLEPTLEFEDLRTRRDELAEASRARVKSKIGALNMLLHEYADSPTRSVELAIKLLESARDSGFNNEAVTKKLAWCDRAKLLQRTAPDKEAARNKLAAATAAVKEYEAETKRLEKAASDYNDGCRIVGRRTPGLAKLAAEYRKAREEQKQVDHHHGRLSAAIIDSRFSVPQ